MRSSVVFADEEAGSYRWKAARSRLSSELSLTRAQSLISNEEGQALTGGQGCTPWLHWLHSNLESKIALPHLGQQVLVDGVHVALVLRKHQHWRRCFLRAGSVGGAGVFRALWAAVSGGGRLIQLAGTPNLLQQVGQHGPLLHHDSTPSQRS